jgi:hypothetical protein
MVWGSQLYAASCTMPQKVRMECLAANAGSQCGAPVNQARRKLEKGHTCASTAKEPLPTAGTTSFDSDQQLQSCQQGWHKLSNMDTTRLKSLR